MHNQQDTELLQDINRGCCSLHFTQATTHKMDYTYYLYDTPLIYSDHFKYLGITLQSNLRYDRHVQDITAKENRTLGVLWRNVRTSSSQLKERAYKYLVRPQLEYACTVWSPWQRYVPCGCWMPSTFIMTTVLTPACPLWSTNLHWDSLEIRQTKSSLVMFYKMFNNLAAMHSIWSLC